MSTESTSGSAHMSHMPRMKHEPVWLAVVLIALVDSSGTSTAENKPCSLTFHNVAHGTPALSAHPCI